MGTFDSDNFGRTNLPLVTLNNRLTDVLAKFCVILHIYSGLVSKGSFVPSKSILETQILQ